MKKADMAMYTSKKNASSAFVSYKETDNVYNRFKMEELMKKAIENKEFVLYYQPQFDIENDKINNQGGNLVCLILKFGYSC